MKGKKNESERGGQLFNKFLFKMTFFGGGKMMPVVVIILGEIEFSNKVGGVFFYEKERDRNRKQDRQQKTEKGLREPN